MHISQKLNLIFARVVRLYNIPKGKCIRGRCEKEVKELINYERNGSGEMDLIGIDLAEMI